MSRAQKLIIQAHESTIAGLREQVAGLKGERSGERRGEHSVAGQLAHDIGQAALRADSYRQARDRAVADVRTLLRVVAGHVLDARAGIPGDSAAAAELLVDAVTLAGLSLTGPIAMVAAERAEADARIGAQMSAAAIASAPIPPRAGAGAAR